MTEQKKARLEARISEKQKQILQEAATVSGQSLTDFLISSALENALRLSRLNGRNLTGQEAGGFHWRRFVED